VRAPQPYACCLTLYEQEVFVSPLKRTAVAFLLVTLLAAASPATAQYLSIVPQPPADLASRNASLEDIAKFAWQEFLALNWKASIDTQHPPSTSNQRGRPDLSWNHKQPVPQFPNPLVWQTYAQTTELRPNRPLRSPWANLTYPRYDYARPIVRGNGSFNLWNNLDEDNEIGSCNIYGQYAAQNPPRELVLFQVKVNRDEYEYVRTTFGATQNIGPSGGASACPSNALLCQAAANTVKNIKNPPYTYYPGATSTCNCPATSICLPCGRLQNNTGLAPAEGAIEVKSAWRRLLPNENPARFYTTQAIYYDTNASGRVAYYNATFALVAMHIIHKTTNFPDFVFATFEQVDVEKSNSYYVVLNNGTEVPPATPIQRQTGQSNRQQLHPVPPTLDAVTARVRAQLVGLNPNTVWQYYRLTGVYGASTDCPVNLNGQPVSSQNCIKYQSSTQCTSINPNYYMDNFMVESDPGLNNFSGTGFANKIFNGGCQNTAYANRIYNNGGCKGCHGVAQTAFGTDFSFLLDFGNNKPSIVPATIHYVAPQPNKPRVKLKHYLDLVKTLQPQP
jgi:hypothetical protein